MPVDHFLHKACINPLGCAVSPAAYTMLHAYAYPGNILELENIIERAMIIETGETQDSVTR